MVTLSHATRCAAPVALSNTITRGAGPTWENTVSNPSHTHSAFSPGSATTWRMFGYGNVATRQCTSVRSPPITARARPKSTCMTPGSHSSSMNPSPGSLQSRLRCRTWCCTSW